MSRLFFAGLTLLSLVLYLGFSLSYGYLGFPLDDAWIHQTFARTLAQNGQWGFFPDKPSAGSTSPLWTLLLAPGYILPVDHRFWAYLLGAILLLSTATIGYRLARRLFPADHGLALATGSFILLEWHLNWAAFSGMEILLFTTLSLLVLELHLAAVSPFWVGLAAGFLTLTRPEGVILALLIVLFRLRPALEKKEWKPLFSLFLGLEFPTLPYLAFHLLVSGNPFPNTFYAKHAEYLAAFGPWWQRPLQVISVTLVGAQALLLPGFLWALILTGRSLWKKGMELPKGVLLILAWWASILLAYAIYLPLTYQHGRYLMPTIPFFVILGLWGSGKLFSRAPWILRQTMLWAGGLLLLIFWGQGAAAYASDVRIIETEMVAAARWIQENTSPQAVVAAHDIGALGYFAERELVDTAGLITPEVIPFIRDEDRLLNYIEEKEVDYFVFFPSWYSKIAKSPDLRLVWVSPSPWIREAGEENIAIYKANWGNTP